MRIGVTGSERYARVRCRTWLGLRFGNKMAMPDKADYTGASGQSFRGQHELMIPILRIKKSKFGGAGAG